MHSGTYRYKRLLFGASSVSEQYQHEVATVLAGIEGVANISDYHHPHARPWDTGPTTTCCTGEAREMRPDLKWREGQFEMDKLVFINLTLARWISFHLAPLIHLGSLHWRGVLEGWALSKILVYDWINHFSVKTSFCWVLQGKWSNPKE